MSSGLGERWKQVQSAMRDGVEPERVIYRGSVGSVTARSEFQLLNVRGRTDEMYSLEHGQLAWSALGALPGSLPGTVLIGGLLLLAALQALLGPQFDSSGAGRVLAWVFGMLVAGVLLSGFYQRFIARAGLRLVLGAAGPLTFTHPYRLRARRGLTEVNVDRLLRQHKTVVVALDGLSETEQAELRHTVGRYLSDKHSG